MVSLTYGILLNLLRIDIQWVFLYQFKSFQKLLQNRWSVSYSKRLMCVSYWNRPYLVYFRESITIYEQSQNENISHNCGSSHDSGISSKNCQSNQFQKIFVCSNGDYTSINIFYSIFWVHGFSHHLQMDTWMDLLDSSIHYNNYDEHSFAAG